MIDYKEFLEKVEEKLSWVADELDFIHPYTTTHSQLSPEELAAQGITPSTVRLSIGTEHIDDIIADIEQALNNI